MPGAETMTLDREISELVGRIDQPELAVELQAVHDDRRVKEIDVFRPEIPVALDDPTGFDARIEQGGTALQEALLRPGDQLRQVR
jgi:hypothetical protein